VIIFNFPTETLVELFLAWLFFKEKKPRYCHQSGVVVGGIVIVDVVDVVVVVTNFNFNHGAWCAASKQGLLYLSLMNIYSKHFSCSLCSFNHKYYHKSVKTADLG